ncbi:electron transport complex subunit RsxC [Halanaerobiaceae bacterium Z-7014]|uniref:Ion-translocating oxidoreductase complex subunit C n=1 Tax=Halonatronomonas betaini TaxID=2778430 RepID=A0A931ANG2_9FIRM|nr:electron transport complex subunit RsxC [Halonatronomonas betaini]MBF8435952.1 electron transport complex subunit RsxC [Halonatronomonas betaini]
MGLLTFKQGIHPSYNKKKTKNKEIVDAERPDTIFIPLQQHIGAPLKPLVERGDQVDRGQKIADTDSFVAAPVHSSVSGVVKGIEKVNDSGGGRVEAIKIEVSEEDTNNFMEPLTAKPENINPDDIRERVREAGIAGMGGAMFPTHVKLAVPDGKKVEYVVLNGAECEPYLTIDHRMMIEKAKEIVEGLKLLMRATGAPKGLIGIEDNKPDAIRTLKSLVADETNIEVKETETKYPQGGEKMLIKALLNREVPVGGLPLDVGVVVNNTSTAAAVYEAVKLGKPLIDRPLTITGSGITKPMNIRVKIGTPVSEIIDQAGGFNGEVGKVILGGPMMGKSQPSLDVHVVKGTSGILVLQKHEVENYSPVPCINCARCVDVCPTNLVPTKLAKLAQLEKLDRMEEMQVMNCIECGSCSYICPSRRPLVHNIRIGKAEVTARNKSE